MQPDEHIHTDGLADVRSQDQSSEAVVVLARRAFSAADASALLSDGTQLQLQFQNDVYSKARSQLDDLLAACLPGRLLLHVMITYVTPAVSACTCMLHPEPAD